MAKKKWIQKAIKKPGSFTKQAEARDMSVSEFGSQVRAHPESYSDKTVKRANLAKTLTKMRKKKK